MQQKAKKFLEDGPAPTPQGRWQGEIHTYIGRTSVELDFKQTGSVYARVAGAPG